MHRLRISPFLPFCCSVLSCYIKPQRKWIPLEASGLTHRRHRHGEGSSAPGNAPLLFANMEYSSPMSISSSKTGSSRAWETMDRSAMDMLLCSSCRGYRGVLFPGQSAVPLAYSQSLPDLPSLAQPGSPFYRTRCSCCEDWCLVHCLLQCLGQRSMFNNACRLMKCARALSVRAP